MKTKLLALAALLAASSLAACKTSPADLPPGEYDHTTSSTDSQGTTWESESKTNVGYDAYGNKRATVQTETTKDPKGLFNKQTIKSTTVITK